jgi:hypothetical protein
MQTIQLSSASPQELQNQINEIKINYRIFKTLYNTQPKLFDTYGRPLQY